MAAVTSSQGRKNSVAGHARWVRFSHWILAASVLTLAFSGFEILMVHPRLYWGRAGNDLTPALFELPISRNYMHGGWKPPVVFSPGAHPIVSAARTYDIFNQNSWGRSLHFLAADQPQLHARRLETARSVLPGGTPDSECGAHLRYFQPEQLGTEPAFSCGRSAATTCTAAGNRP